MRAGTQNSIDGLQDKELFPENNRKILFYILKNSQMQEISEKDKIIVRGSS